MGTIRFHSRLLCVSLLMMSALFASSLVMSTNVFAVSCNSGESDATTGHATDGSAATCSVSESFEVGTGELELGPNTDTAVTFICTPSLIPCVYPPSVDGVTAPFNFTAHVTDARNDQSTGTTTITQVGWHMNETFSTLTNDMDTAANITSVTITNTIPLCETNFTCTITPIGELNSATFSTGTTQLAFNATTAGTSGNPQTSSGTYRLITYGSLHVPGSAPAGSTYTGTITLGLVSSPV